jgi:hypothetical protein
LCKNGEKRKAEGKSMGINYQKKIPKHVVKNGKKCAKIRKSEEKGKKNARESGKMD